MYQFFGPFTDCTGSGTGTAGLQWLVGDHLGSTAITANASGTQTQTFAYDALNRLISAQASGGSGGTYGPESYTYDSATGNLSTKAGMSYGYNDSTHKHAVTHLNGAQKYWYGANGNQTTRVIGSDTYNLGYDAGFRLLTVNKNGASLASFVYDGDGNRVKGTVSGVTTAYVGSYFEWTGSTSTMKKYYYASGTRVAMRTGAGTGNVGLQWLAGDHLGSTAVTANASGTNKDAELRYKAWGEQRYTSGTTPTTYRFTGQRSEEAGIGLYWFNSRWYDSSLSRFAQPDTLVPGGSPLAWDRYAYSLNAPTKYIDPSGHSPIRDDPEKNAHWRLDYHEYHSTTWLKGYSEYSLRTYSQLQRDNTDACAPYSIAMAANLEQGDKTLTGSGVERHAEQNLHKYPGYGMRPSWQAVELRDLLPENIVVFQQGDVNLLVNNLVEGNPTVVSVSWENNLEIAKGLLSGGATVGHAMVLVGFNPYDKNREFKFLNPADFGDRGIWSMSNQDFMKSWAGQPNIFIPSSSTVTIY